MPVRILERNDPYRLRLAASARRYPMLPMIAVDDEVYELFREQGRHFAKFGVYDYVLGGSYAGFFLLQNKVQRLTVSWQPLDVDVFLPRDAHPRDEACRPYLWCEPPNWICPFFGELPTEFIFHPQVHTSADAIARVASFDTNATQCCVHVTCNEHGFVIVRPLATAFALKFRACGKLRPYWLRLRLANASERYGLLRRFANKIQRRIGWGDHHSYHVASAACAILMQ